MEEQAKVPSLAQPSRQETGAGVAGVLFVGDLPARAELFSQAVEPLRLEGVVAKQRTSVYAPGVRSRDWVKIKRAGWQEGRAWRN